MLVDKRLKDYLDLLGSDAPAPGGGASGALSGAQGAALGIMVADLTLGREEYAEHQELCMGVRETLLNLKTRLTDGIDKDAEAFGGFAAAMKMSRATEDEKDARSKAIREAAKYATEVPFETMMLCLEALNSIKVLPGRSNRNAVSDIGVAAYELLSGIKASWLNVKINLTSLKNDEEADRYARECDKILKEGEQLAQSIYQAVEEMI